MGEFYKIILVGKGSFSHIVVWSSGFLSHYVIIVRFQEPCKARWTTL